MSLEVQIQGLAGSYARALQEKIAARKLEMQADDLSHHLIYRVLETLYLGLGGQYHAGDQAWEFVQAQTGVDLNLKQILEQIGTA